MRKFLLQLKVLFFHSSRSRSQLRDFDLTQPREAVTSWRHSMTHPNLFSLSQLVDVLERSFRFVSMKLWVAEFENVVSLYLHDDVTSWRQVMTSKTGCTLSQLVEVLERWFFFIFYSFPARLVWKCYRFGVCMMSWRHGVTSWRHKTHFSSPISACRCSKMMIHM